MEVRLNKLLSDSGLCSRREADLFIEMGRVTVNGQLPSIGQKVTETDIVLVDGEQVRFGKHSVAGTIKAAPGKSKNLIMGAPVNKQIRRSPSKSKSFSGNKPSSSSASSSGERREHYGKYNKYAAARRAAKEREEKNNGSGKPTIDREQAFREALQPKFGKSLGRSAVAQRVAASPKSAALRKTSRNNPVNKAKRAAERKRQNDNE